MPKYRAPTQTKVHEIPLDPHIHDLAEKNELDVARIKQYSFGAATVISIAPKTEKGSWFVSGMRGDRPFTSVEVNQICNKTLPKGIRIEANIENQRGDGNWFHMTATERKEFSPREWWKNK